MTRLLGLPAAKARLLGMKVWQRAIPQYIVGYPEQWQRVTDALRQTRGLFLCSNYADGVALGDRAEHGNRTAAAVAAYLSGGHP